MIEGEVLLEYNLAALSLDNTSGEFIHTSRPDIVLANKGETLGPLRHQIGDQQGALLIRNRPCDEQMLGAVPAFILLRIDIKRLAPPDYCVFDSLAG